MNHRLVGVALLLCVVTAGCSSMDSGSSEAAVAPAQQQDAGASGAGEMAPAQEEQPGTAGRTDISQPGVDRTLVRTASVELEAADVAGTVNQARDIAVTEGGYSGQEDVGQRSATLTLRIPSDRFDQALDALSRLGEVISRTQTAEDVTEQVVDLESRIATQRASVNRVRELLARATTVDEIVRIEQEVTTREADLESLEQRRQALAGQVAMSTVTIRVNRTDAAPQEEESSGFLTGLSDGWDAFLGAGAVTLRVLGAVLPFVVVLGVPTVLAIRWWRRRRTAAPVVQQP